MPRITLWDLPVEVHFKILKYVLYSSQRKTYGRFYFKLDWDEPDDPTVPIVWEWLENDTRSLSQFPYNVDATCPQWHAVLTNIPECWTRIIFDVTADPQRFIKAFRWSKNLPKIEVVVFTSATFPEEVDSTLERRRVSAIVNVLRPHAHRCKSIVFDVMFSTSLPSPVIFLLRDAPDLEELVVECKVDNAGTPENYSRTCGLGTSRRVQVPASIPQLKKLSMTGFWFMFISGHPRTSKWLKKLRNKDEYLTLCVSQFQFQQDGQYTLRNFVSYCSKIGPSTLVLRDLSLNCANAIINEEYFEKAFSNPESVTFVNVSPELIESLFFLADVSPEYLTFSRCSFPDEILPSSAVSLHLEYIGQPPVEDSSPQTDTTNIRSILQEWTGGFLEVVSCPSFDDYLLASLETFPFFAPQSLYLRDCNSFTPRNLRHYLQIRNQGSVDEPSGVDNDQPPGLYDSCEPFAQLSAHGHCPFLSMDDQGWFQTSTYAKSINVDWHCCSPTNFRVRQDFHKKPRR